MVEIIRDDEINEKTCYDCAEWACGSEDGTCIHYINADCRWDFSLKKPTEKICREMGIAYHPEQEGVMISGKRIDGLINTHDLFRDEQKVKELIAKLETVPNEGLIITSKEIRKLINDSDYNIEEGAI